MAADPLVICKRGEELQAARQAHEILWRECFDYSFPLRGSGLASEVINNAADGQNKRAELLDGTSTDAARVLASALMSGLTPSNALWGALHVTGADDDGKDWLDYASRTMHEEIHSSNFDASAFEAMLDMVGGGWFGLYVDRDTRQQSSGYISDEWNGYLFEQWPISELFCSASRPGGPIDIVYRRYCLTAQQAVQEFGRGRVSPRILDDAEHKPQAVHHFWRAIYPRAVYDPQARLGRNMPIASCTVEIATKTLVREAGYHEMPVIVPRWVLIPQSVYAVGPMFDALPDVKELNELKLMEKQAAALSILPPFKAKDDGVLNVGAIKRLKSGKIYAVEDMENFQPIMQGSKFELALSSEERLQAAIRRTLMADQLQWGDGGPAKTATEIHARIALIRQLLGPVYGRLQAEYLTPLVTRCFGLALRGGILGRPPDSLADQPYTVKYQSPLARAQKLEDVTAIERLTANVTAIAAIKPEVVDVIDGDQQVRDLADALGTKVRSADEVLRIRKERQEAEAEMQQKQIAQQGALMTMEAGAKRMANAT